MKRVILAFGHKRLRGKDTSGAIAMAKLSELGYPVKKDSFVRSLKEGIGKQVFGMSDEQLYGKQKEVVDPFWGFTPRWMLQHVGTELFRNRLDTDIWSKTVERRIKSDPKTSIVMTDVRFMNEVQTIKRLGGYVIKCVRQVEFDPEQDEHLSETDLDNYNEWDYVLDNTGTIEALEEQVEAILNEVLTK